MSQKIYTYEHKVSFHPDQTDKTDLEIDYDIEGNIHEIRAWSYEFQHWIPVQLIWLKAVLPAAFEDLENEVKSNINSPDVA